MIRSLGKIFVCFSICGYAHSIYTESTVLKEFLKEPWQTYNHTDAKKKQKFNALKKKTARGYTSLSQTEIHLAKHFYDKLHRQNTDPLVIDMCHRIINQELQEAKKGRYTLLHAQPWKFNLLEDIYTALWQKLHNISFDKYIFTRFRRLSLDEKDLKKHMEIRTELLAHGPKVGYNKAGETSICVNFGLFCNEDSTNSFDFFLGGYGRNVPYHMNLAHIFKQLNIEKYYHMFQYELDALAQEHEQLTKYGHILMFSLTPMILKKTVYPTTRRFRLYKTTSIDASITDIQQLFDTFRKNPWQIDTDNYHFCIILGKDCGLIPGNGLDVYEFNAVDKKCMQALEQKKKALLDKIILNIDYDMAKEPTKAQKLMQAIIVKAHLWKKYGCIVAQNNLWNQYLQQQVGKLFN